MENQDTMTIFKDGVEVNCDICFSFYSEDTNRGYVACTDHSVDENGNELIYAYSYDPNDPNEELVEVTNDELALVDEVKNKIANKVMGGNNE